MEWKAGALECLGQLIRVGEVTQKAILLGDVGALPGLVQREAELAATLEQCLESAPAGAGGASELARQAAAWQRLHEQNRMLLEHAHRTVVALLALFTSAGDEASGLYAPPHAQSVAGRTLAPVAPLSVDRRA